MNKTKAALRKFPGISVDRDGKYYYYVSKTKSAYFIKTEDMKMAEVLAYRPYIAISVGVVLYSIIQGNWIFYVALTAAIYLLLEWYSRTKMRARCRLVKPYTKVILKNVTSPQKTTNLILKTVLYVVAAGLLVWTIIDQKNEGASLAVLIAMVGVCVFGAIQNIGLLLKKD